MNCYIVDIDGTIADTEHRIHYITDGHKNWDAWHANARKDRPIEEVVDLLDMAKMNDIKIVLCTARDCGVVCARALRGNPTVSPDGTDGDWRGVRRAWGDVGAGW